MGSPGSKLKRDPFARRIPQKSEEPEPELRLRFPPGEFPETFRDLFVAEQEGPFPSNPYVDYIECDPVILICAGLFGDEAPELPKPKKAVIGWEEYKRRQSILRREERRKRKTLARVNRVLRDDGFQIVRWGRITP